jgi:copper chaperone
VFKVANMDCEHCKKTIDSALRNIRGVKDVKIDLNVKLVEVTGSPSSAHIKSAIQNAGYTIVEREIKS